MSFLPLGEERERRKGRRDRPPCSVEREGERGVRLQNGCHLSQIGGDGGMRRKVFFQRFISHSLDAAAGTGSLGAYVKRLSLQQQGPNLSALKNLVVNTHTCNEGGRNSLNRSIAPTFKETVVVLSNPLPPAPNEATKGGGVWYITIRCTCFTS